MPKPSTKSTPKKNWKPRALRALAKGATVTEAAAAAGISRFSIYAAVNKDVAFRVAYEDAIEQGTDLIEAAATTRAVVGVEEPVIYQGQVTFIGIDANGKTCDPASPLAVRNVPLTVRKPSDLLAIFLLKGRRPKKFRDNVAVDVSGGIDHRHDVRPMLNRLASDPAAYADAKALAARMSEPAPHAAHNGNGHHNGNGNGNGH